MAKLEDLTAGTAVRRVFADVLATVASGTADLQRKNLFTTQDDGRGGLDMRPIETTAQKIKAFL